MYEKHGLGLYMVETKAEGQPVGMCGLIKRDSLDDVDLGFALPDAIPGPCSTRSRRRPPLSRSGLVASKLPAW